MDDIPREALVAIEERFASRFVRHAAGEPDAGQRFASVFPRSAEEVEFLMRLAARHSIPLAAHGAGTAIYPGKAPWALAVRFDAMRAVRLPEDPQEAWVEVEPGVTWMALEERLRARGMGPRVYPTSAPKATVGGWLVESGLGVGSYEYGWLIANVLSVEAVTAGGGRDLIEGETLRYFVGSRGRMGFLLKARLATRHAGDDVPVAAIFRDSEDLAGAVLDLYRGGAQLWHLAFLNAAMSRARGFEEKPVLFGAYPGERAGRVEPALREAVELRGGSLLSREEAHSVWEQRFFPASPLGPIPRPGRALVQGAHLVPTLVEIERKLEGMAIQGTVAWWGEISLLAFDPAPGDPGVADLPADKQARLLRVANLSWMPER